MPDHDPQSLPNRVAAGFAKVSLVLRHEAWQSAGQKGLTPTQAQILSLIAAAPDEIGLKAVSANLAITAGTASEAVSALEAKDLLRKQRSADDGRALVLKLTAAGRRAARAAARWPDTVLQAAASLTADEQAGLVRGLVAMVRSLQQQGLVPPARMCVECRYFRPHAHAGARQPHHCEFIDAAIGDADLRLDCPEMEPVAAGASGALWDLFVHGEPAQPPASGPRPRSRGGRKRG